MRRTLSILGAGAIALGLAFTGVAGAEPGPNGKNDFGLCKAYLHGSDKGKENKQSKGPFPGLAEDAGEQGVETYCETVYPGGKDEPPPSGVTGASKPSKDEEEEG